MATQLGLDLPARAALGRDDFLVAPSNALAMTMIDDWQNWPLRKMVLSGPEGSGKTHLTHVWAAASGARIIAARDLTIDLLDIPPTGPIAVEDVPLISKDIDIQTTLFHLHNQLAEAGQHLLMTGTQAPSLWAMSLPDLQSRIDAAGHAALDPADDNLLAAVLGKLFNDRQLTPRADVIPYLVTHMERSFEAARRIVATLDATSLARKKPVTRALAAELLDIDTGDRG
ncbi:DnaA/Hda family protein [Tateyamaria sp. Alg231-49]|uniref:DnaA ATPase domain-containing protein n=1 Tax=Tateyamaria sp. Alg231-49 TaxID=1922219 RepID=UPI000D54C38A|nr:DnaA/Hda family protein [Tateyamaria sp. Alg231-49]